MNRIKIIFAATLTAIRQAVRYCRRARRLRYCFGYEFIGSSQPLPERYKGTFPGSEPETAALIRLTQDYHIKRAISYHTCGTLIYWYFKQSGNVLAESEKFANEIKYVTDYPLDGDYVNPVPKRQFNTIWARNKNMVYATVYNLRDRL